MSEAPHSLETRFFLTGAQERHGASREQGQRNWRVFLLPRRPIGDSLSLTHLLITRARWGKASPLQGSLQEAGGLSLVVGWEKPGSSAPANWSYFGRETRGLGSRPLTSLGHFLDTS